MTRFQISRAEQDDYAAQSQQRTETAQKAGRFKDEIIPVAIPQRKGEPVVFDTDEFPRHGATSEARARRRPLGSSPWPASPAMPAPVWTPP